MSEHTPAPEPGDELYDAWCYIEGASMPPSHRAMLRDLYRQADAAPDLLAACELAVAACDPTSPRYEDWESVALAARAALAKAEGGTDG